MSWFLLMVAGNDSTRATFCSGLKSLLEDPEQLELVRSGEVSTEQAVEEFLRCHPAFAYMRRTATRDTEIAGQPVARGRQGAALVRLGQPRRDGLRGPAPLRRAPGPEPAPGVRRRRPALLPGRRARAPGDEALARGDAAPVPGPSPGRRRRRAWRRPSSTSGGRSRSRRADLDGPRRAARGRSTPSRTPVGASADGEAPGCCGAMRARSTPGRILKRSGGSSSTVSPSMPGVHGRARPDLELGRRPLAPRPPAQTQPAASPRSRHRRSRCRAARRRSAAAFPSRSPSRAGSGCSRRGSRRPCVQPARGGSSTRGPARARPGRPRREPCRAAFAASRRGSPRAARPRRRRRARRC